MHMGGLIAVDASPVLRRPASQAVTAVGRQVFAAGLAQALCDAALQQFLA
jgi:hypothetical protein